MIPIRPGGVPLHPALVHFPIACWTAALGLELLALATGDAGWWRAGAVALAAGSLTGLAAMAAGLLEYAALAERPRLARLAERHMLLAGLAWTCFTADWLWRQSLAAPGPPAVPWPALGLLALSGGGFVLLVAAGHAGARLVYRHGVGIEEERS